MSLAQPVEVKASRVAIVIDESTYFREMMLCGGQFCLSVACKATADLIFLVPARTIPAHVLDAY